MKNLLLITVILALTSTTVINDTTNEAKVQMINGVHIFMYSKPTNKYKVVHTMDTRIIAIRYAGIGNFIRSALGRAQRDKERGLIGEYNGILLAEGQDEVKLILVSED